MEDFAYDNVLIEEKSFANILLYVIFCKYFTLCHFMQKFDCF